MGYGNFEDDFPSPEAEAAFRKFNGSRVGQDAEDWNRDKRAFVAGWEAARALLDRTRVT